MYVVCYVHIEKEQDGDRCPKGTERERNIDKKERETERRDGGQRNIQINTNIAKNPLPPPPIPACRKKE